MIEKYVRNERYLGEKLFTQMGPGIEEFSFTQGRECYDASIYMKNGTKIIGEIKVRDMVVDKYPDYFLEVQKLQNLIKKCNSVKYHKIYYINFFNNENPYMKDFIVFDLTPRLWEWKTNPPKVENLWMNAATFKSRTQKMSKAVIRLKFDERYDMKSSIFLN